MKLIPEWHEHQYCFIAWPCNIDLYGDFINFARVEVANVIDEIAKTERVIVLSNEKDVKEAIEIDPFKKLELLNLNEHISSQRSNGLNSMILKIKDFLSKT